VQPVKRKFKFDKLFEPAGFGAPFQRISKAESGDDFLLEAGRLS